MAVTSLSICNMALSLIGNKSFLITALNEDSEPARQCNLWYEPIRDATLMAHPWNFAIRRAELSQISDTPAYGYAYAYSYPDDFLKVVQTDMAEEAGWEDYRSEGQLGTTTRVLLSDEGEVAIEYIAKITDPNAYSPMFVQALVTHLAATICVPLTDSQTRADKIADRYKEIVREARSVDAQEGTPRGLDADTWLNARY